VNKLQKFLAELGYLFAMYRGETANADLEGIDDSIKHTGNNDVLFLTVKKKTITSLSACFTLLRLVTYNIEGKTSNGTLLLILPLLVVDRHFFSSFP